MSWLSDRVVDHLRVVADLPDLSRTKYRLLRRLAQGGMGTVYLAHDSELDRTVALKALSLPDSSGELAVRMLREAKIVARLEHPGIVPIHDAGTLVDGRVFYAMKFVQGKRLDEHHMVPSSLHERLAIFQKICEAVSFAHARGVIHRDLKPENIMVGAFGEILVMDWGLAKILSTDHDGETSRFFRTMSPDSVLGGAQPDALNTENDLCAAPQSPPDSAPSNSALESISPSTAHETLHGSVLGTPLYMAPEQARGEIDRIDQRTDIYALGAILGFLLRANSVTRSLRATPEGSITARLFGQRSPDTKIPKALAAICAKAMAPERDERYANALDLAADIERFVGGFAVSAHKENPLERAWRWLVKFRFMVLLVLGYLLARILLLFWLRS